MVPLAGVRRCSHRLGYFGQELPRGQAGHIAEVLEKPLLLPRDMEAYRRFNQQELFLSLKRDLAMVSNLIHFST